MADWFQVPAVSTATGKKIWEADSAPYFTVLFAAALFAIIIIIIKRED